MATTTPNYGWPVPTSTDYVKDGATAIEALGDAIDATVFGLSSSGLTLINAGTFSGATTTSLPTSSFSATYQNYLLVFVITSTHTAGDTLRFRYRTSGTDNTTANYFMRSSANISSTTAYITDSSATSAQLTFLSSVGLVAGEVKFQSPNAATVTRHQVSITGASSGDSTTAWVGGGTFATTTVFDSISLISSAGNLAGNYKLYGYDNA
jgi:hypothetical protein